MSEPRTVLYGSEATVGGLPYVEEPVAYDAILLAGFGGPEGQADVIPFLRNVTRGRGIPDDRLEEVAQHYRHFGGVSPINAQNKALRKAIEDALDEKGISLPVYWGNRNWEPYLDDVVQRASANGHNTLLAFATSAYSSFSSCRQYREDFARVLEETGLGDTVTIDKIRPFFDHPGFVAAFVGGVRTAVSEFLEAGFEASAIEVLFSTHSVPVDDAQRSGARNINWGDGGAYAAQHQAVAAWTMGQVKELLPGAASVAWQLVYQSRSGPPSQPWLEPDVVDVIETLPRLGRRAVIVVPVGFLSDHMEVLWDLDSEAAEAAEAAGLRFIRTPTPGVSDAFVNGIVDLVQERLEGRKASERQRVTSLAPSFDVCRPGCCENIRAGFKPAAAGVLP